MDTEIEVKFLPSEHEMIRGQLKAPGVVCEESMRLMKRTMLDSQYLWMGKEIS